MRRCADIWHLMEPGRKPSQAGDGVADVFASPVEVSDVGGIREPGIASRARRGGGSERVIWPPTPSFTAGTGRQLGLPVSMPQDAARRFAQVQNLSSPPTVKM